MHFFFDPDIAERQYLSEEESRHCIRVLRMQKDDPILITDGKGNLFHARIADADPKACKIIIEKKETKAKNNYHTHIALAPVKNSDRIEWFIEKATEIGIDEISFFISEHSERNKLNTDRLHKTAVSAMKQSLRTFLPVINPLEKISDFIKNVNTKHRFIAVSSESKNALLHSAVTGQSCCIMIGPEGGFSEKETEEAIRNGFVPVSLGTHRLRTETAALAACHTLNLINNS